MNFIQVLREVLNRFDAEGVRYALIGGFAMALRGVQRTTTDLDFVLMLEDLETANKVLLAKGYERTFHSENVSHFQSKDAAWGRIDVLHAFRGPSLSMLERAELIEVDSGLKVPVVQIEDLVGLKVQAAVNDPKRAIRDWSDIQILLQNAGARRQILDWELISDYLAIFDMSGKLGELKALYGPTD